MKLFSLLTLFLLFLSACSDKNAFYHFHMSKAQELSEDAMLSSKIYKGDIADGLVVVLYLNAVLPKEYSKKDSFYVYLYTKSTQKSLHFTLNEKEPINVEKLTRKNHFSNLLSLDAKWAEYYLVEFKHDSSEQLNFKVNDAHFSCNNLTFERND